MKTWIKDNNGNKCSVEHLGLGRGSTEGAR